MLVFYTWSVRFTADAISMMSSTEKIGWLATKTPQEGEALYEPDVAGGKDAGEAGKKMISVSTICKMRKGCAIWKYGCCCTKFRECGMWRRFHHITIDPSPK